MTLTDTDDDGGQGDFSGGGEGKAGAEGGNVVESGHKKLKRSASVASMASMASMEANLATFKYQVLATSMKGQKAEMPNQDCWCAVQAGLDFAIYGVFDGHGRSGHDVSNYVKENLPKFIMQDQRLGTAAMAELMHDAFRKMTEMIDGANDRRELNAGKSGTTATVVVHDYKARLLTVSHVGDSGAALARGANCKGQYLTPDHKPNLPGEKKRILRCGGAVNYDGYNYRVHKKGGYGPELNMSRSFGDLWGRSAGIISEPDTTQIKLASSDKFLLLCSDGVWEFMSAQDAADVVHEALQKRESGAHVLARAAADRWEENHPNGGSDDITVLLVQLQEREEPAQKVKSAMRRSESFLSQCSAVSQGSAPSGLSSPSTTAGSVAADSHRHAPRVFRRSDSQCSALSAGPAHVPLQLQAGSCNRATRDYFNPPEHNVV